MSTASMQAAASAPTCPLMIGPPYTRACRMNRQQARRPVCVTLVVVRLPFVHFDFGDRPVGALADGIDVQVKEDVAHRGVADDDQFVDRFRIDGKGFDGVREIAGERAIQQLAAMLRVVVNSRHDVGAAETLRILERSIGD